ncbi:hypothetical protein G9C98_006515 [Cotesia typhae]|uniref:Uncharacterized protein n=1 Tax=Cotesia typhae TaxID=2053667 RepID=A0A8J5UUZ5_9HYME|nr:hypothetical protein G9C98_006515 [Cotesia typhae]
MIVDEFKRQEFYPIEDPLVKEIKIKVQEIVLLSSCSADDGIKEEILRDIVSAEVEKYVAVLKDVEDLCEAKQSQETAVKAGIDKKDDIKEEIKDLTGIGKEEQAKTDIQKETEDIKQKQGVLESILVSEDMIREELKKQDLYPVEDPLVKEIKGKIEEEIVLSPFVPEEMVKELISAEVNKHVADLKEIEGLDKAKEMSVASQVDKKEEISLNKAKIEESEDVKDVKREEIKSLGISDDMIREELKKQDLYPVEDPLVKEIKAKVQEEILLSSHTTEENIPEEMIRDLILVEVEKYVGQIKETEKFGSAQENLRKDQEASLREEIESKEEAGIRAEEDEDKNTKKESDVLKGLIVSEDMIRNELKKQQLYPVEDPLVKDIKTKVEEVIFMSSHTLEEIIPDEIIRDLILVEIEKHVAELKYDDSINEIEAKESISLLQKESISKEEIKDLKEKVEESVQGDKTASQKQIVEPKDILMEAQVLEQRENTAIASQYTISEDKIHELVVSELDKQNAKSLVDDELKNKITLKIQQLIISRPEVVKEDTIESSVGEIVQEEIQKQAKLVETQKLDSAKSLEVSTEEGKKISEDVVRDIIVAHLKKQNLNTSEEADVLNTVEEKAGNLMSECPEMCTVDAIEVTVEEIVRKTLTERATSQKLEVLIVPSETHEEVPEETIHEMVIDEVHRNNIEPTEEYRIIERIEAKIQQLILLHPEISDLNFLSEKVHDFVEEIVEEDKAEVVEIENLLRAEEEKREIEVLEMPLVPEIEEIVEEEIDEQTIKSEAKADVHDLESKKSEQQVITLDKEVCEVQKDKEVIKDAAVEEENKNSRREERKEAEEIIEVSKDKVQEETRKIEETEDKYGGKIAGDISEKKIEEEMKEVSDNDKFAKEESKNESIEVVKQTEVEEMSKEKVIESEDKIKEAKEADKVSEEMDLKKKEEIKIGDQKKEKVQILRVPSETHAHVSEEMVHEIVVGEIHKLNIEPSKEDNLIKAVEFKVQDLIAQFPELSKEEIIEENVKHIVAEQLQEEKAKASEFDETMDKAQVQTKVEVLQTPATTQIQVPEEMVHDLIIEELQKQDVQMSEENNLVKAIESKVNDLIAQHPEISREEIIEESVREIVTEKLQEHKANVLEAEKLERAQADELKKKVEVLNVPALGQVEVPEENVHGMIIEEFNKQNIEPLTHENLVKAVEAKIKDLIAQHPDIRKSDVLEENVRDIITEVWAEERASVVEQEKLAEAKEEIVNKTKVEVLRMPDKQHETAQIIEEIDRGVGVKDALKVKRKSSDKGEKDEKKSPKDELEKSGIQDGEENKRASVKSKSRKSEDKGVEDKNRDSLKKKHSEELGDKNKGEKRRTSLKEKAEDNGEDVDKKRRESLKKSEKTGNEDIEGKTRKEAEKKKEIEEKNRDSLKKKHSEELGDKNKEEKRRTSLKDKDNDVEEKTRDSLKKKKQSEESDDKSKDVEEKIRASLKEKPEDKKKDIEEKQDSLKIIEDKDVEEKTRSSLKKKSVKSEDKDKNEEEEKRRTSLKEKEEKSKDKDKFEEEKRRTSLKEKVEDSSKDSEKKRRESLKKSEKSDDKGKNVEEKRRKSLKEKDESNDKDADKRRTSLKKKSEKSVDNDKGVEERRPSLKMRSEEKEDIKVKQLDSQKTDKESKIIDAPKEEKERLKEDSILQLDKSVVQKTDEKSRDTKEEYRRVTEDNQVAAKQPDSKLLKANIDSELDSEFSESSVSTLKNVSTKERYKRSNPPMIEIDYDESSPREASWRSNLSRKYRDLESIDLDDKSLGVYSTDTSRTAGVSHGPRDRGKKPSFCTKLTDRTAAESSRIKLTCAVLGEPEPAVYWLKDGKLLPPSSNRHGITLENGMASLELYTVRPSDTGEYSCIARNPHGQACTEAKLKVYAGYEPTPTTPTFTRTIKDTYLREENTLVLECRVRGQPTPAITWLKDGQVLEISERYQQCDLPDGLCRLKIFNPDFYDSGRAAQSSRSWRGNSYNDITSTEKDTGRPRFSSYLTDHSVPVGGTIALQVEVKGVPPPDVTWMRADKKGSIAVPKARTFADSGVYTLIVPDATEYETGTYVCRASNSYGHVDTTATIEVVSGSLGDGGKPAMFVSRPPDKVIIVAVGEDVIIWMKGLRDITSGPRSYKEGHDDYVRLTLKRACPSDEGTYCILVKNRYGCDRSFFSVQVKQRARSLTPSPDWGSVDTDSLLANIHDKERSYLKQVPGPISTEPVVIDGGRNWLALTWGKAEQRGSAPVVAYRVDGWLLGGEGGARWVELGVTPINAFDAFNLRPGEEYKFRITPRNRYGWGEPVTMTNSVTVREVVKFPEFTKILPGQLKALEGTVLNLDCEVSSDSLAHVKWYRDTTEIENGQDSRSSDIANEERPPEFTMRLRDRRVQATYPVRLTCQVTGYPEPEVTWYKYREELCSQENISIWNDEAHFHTLEINRSTIDDFGIYMARAKNIYGSVSCRCHLTVDKGIRAYIAPEFLRHLDSIYTVKAGGELRMTAQIEAYPTVGVTWHRDGHRLRPSRDVVMTLNHDGSVELDLAHVTPRDAGLYCCTATNEVGQTETTTRVTVLDNDDIKSEPVFVTKPLSTEAFEGDTVIISCEVVGDPKPEVIWLRDFLRPDYYKDAPHFRRVGAGPQYRLEIPYAKLDFTGTYSIIAKNCHGEAKAVISLQIYARGQGKEDSGMESTIKHGNVQTLPVIKRPLRDLRCCDGDAITLVCKLHAKPEPDIRWEKGGKLLPLGGDFATDFDGETARLSIQHVYPEDEGEYTCFLSANSTPISTPRSTPVRSLSPSCCKREVKPVTKTTCGYTGGRRPRMPTSPKFYAVPHNKVAEEGETVRFQCAIAGHPVPWVTWDKDGISITPTARISLKESDDVRILEITEITHEDAGLYRVTLENDVGRTEATARLEIIKGRRSSISRPIRTRSASPRTYSIYGGRNPSPTPRSDSRLQPPRISDTYSGGRGTSPTLPRWHYRNGNAVNDEKINAKTSSTELNKPRSSSVPRHCKMEREKSNVKQVSESPIKNRKTRPSQHVTAPTQSSARKTSIPVRRKSSVKLNSNKQDKIDSKDKEKNYNSKDKNLKKKIKEEFKSPVILTVPADIIALRGAKVMLLTTYDGYPRPTVRWLRKGRDVTLDDKTEIETSAGLTCLTLLNVTTEEAGKYEVFIENKLGKDSRHVNVTVEGPPEPPAGSPAIQIIKDSRGVTLSWRSPVYDGGCAVTGYSVEMRRGEEPCWVAVAEAKHSLSHTISGLDPEESYQFRVRAENIHGLSEPGMESETVIITKSETRKITTNISGFSLDPNEDTEDEIEPAYEPCVVTPESGFLFDERYNVLEELGKGKYGVVRRIVDKSNGSSFAAKFVRTIKAKDRQQVNDEINIMNMLRHPKLLRLIAAFESPREMIMVTEYISGGELFERVVADDFTLTEKDSILFVRQICMGVDYMHGNLVVHLDLKPENIMCHTRTSHRIKLIDFGLAQTLKPDTPVRVLFGTPEFIPPEIIGFEPIGTESDMWSVGVICYVLLTGLSPFMGENDAETFANITRADFDFDHKAFSAISEEAKDFISGLLIKRKESRMSAKECLKHPWLAQRAESMSRVALPTDKLKKFIVRRKWQKTGNAIRALGRMAILSANSRKNSESLSDVSKEVTTPTNEDIIITEDSLDDPIKINNINTDNSEFSNGRISKADSDELQITELSSGEYVDSLDIDTCDSSTIIETQRSISPEDFTKIEDKINVNKISTSDSLPSERFDIDDDLLSSDLKKIKIMSDEADNKTDTFISELNSSEENIYTVDISMESLKTTSEIHEEFSENYCSITSLHINEPSFEVKEEITISRISLQDKDDNKFVNLIGEQNLKSNSSIVNKNDNNDDKIPATRPNFIPIESNTNSHGSVCKPCSLHRVVRTGSVSRTAKMFEQEQVSSSARQQLSPGSRIVLPAANARPQNERIRKAFAFWNK